MNIISNKFPRIIHIIGVNILVFLGFFILTEIILRIMGIGYGSAPHNPDPIYHHVNPKSYEFTVHDPNNEFGGHNVYYDQFGHRYNPIKNRTEKSKTRWLFLGDSFTASTATKYEDSFVGIIEMKNQNVQVINFGTSSYSPVLYYLLIKNEILSWQNFPSLICIQLYSNDIRDDKNYLKQANFNDDGELIGIDGRKSNWYIQLLRKSYFIRLIRKSQLTLQFLMQDHSGENVNIVGNYVEDMPRLKNTFSEYYLIEISKLLKTSNIKFILTAIPSKYQCVKKNFKGTIIFSDQVKNWSKENNIEFVDATKAFKEHVLSEKPLPFYKNDIHLNELGNELMANELMKHLK